VYFYFQSKEKKYLQKFFELLNYVTKTEKSTIKSVCEVNHKINICFLFWLILHEGVLSQ
jgi:hypothetical protein